MRRDSGRTGVIVEKWPPRRAALHLLLLLAGARVIRIVAPRRAWFWTARLTVLLRIFSRNPGRATFRVFGTRLITVALSDDYWMPAVLLGQGNEPEILAVLSRTLTPGSLFIDAGANIGWWSLFASTIISDPARVIALEPAEETFSDLRRNALLNQSSFTCLRVAAWDHSNLELPFRFDGKAREAAHVELLGSCWEGSGGRQELVPSVRIDDLLEERTSCDGPLVLKLDVEGAELQALQGTSKHITDFDLVIYEDHGKEPTALVTTEMMRLGFTVFFGDQAGNIQPVTTIADAQAIKSDPRRGYNFFAMRTPLGEACDGLPRG